MQTTAFGARIGATRRVTYLLATASFASLAGIAAAQGAAAPPPQVAAAPPPAPVEEVLITGSVISGSAAVGVSVTALGADDFESIAEQAIRA